MSIAQPNPPTGPVALSPTRIYATGGVALVTSLAAPEEPQWLRPVAAVSIYALGAVKVVLRK
ncbi:hypothetical protein ACWFRJ_18870 [Streptomyces sp. NPDC055239]